MSTIPKHIEEKIEAEAKSRWALSDERFSEEDFKQGAQYGYQLASEEIERLIGLIKKTVVACDCQTCQNIWDKFKSENNIK